MAVVMILIMGKMYPNKKLNASIIVGSIVLFGIPFGFKEQKRRLAMFNI